MAFGRLSSLRVRLLAILALALVPALLLLASANWKIWQSARTHAEHEARRLAGHVGVRHREYVETARRTLQQMATRHTGQEAAEPGAPPKTRPLRNSYFSNVGMVDRDGDVVMSGIPADHPVNAAPQPWFHRAAGTDRFIVEHRGSDPVTGTPAVVCALPLHPPGVGFAGALFAVLDADMIHGQMLGETLPQGTHVEFFNGSGVLLAESPAGSRATRPPMSSALMARFQDTTGGGGPPHGENITEEAGWLQLIHRIPGPPGEGGAFIVVSLPLSAVTAHAMQEIVLNMLVFLAVLVLSGALAWLGCDRLIVRRAEALVSVTERLAGGDMAARAGGGARGRKGDELDELAEKFDRMAERLQQQDRERAQLEEQVRLAQKMEAVGLLAGGVAHDFNNLLQVISGSTLLAQGKIPADSPVRKHLDDVRQSSERATKLTRQLLAMTRQQALNKEPAELNELLASLLSVIRRTIGEHIEVSFHPEEKSAWTFADRGQIEQVLLNLCLNARDAMPGGGRLELRTRHLRREQGGDGARGGDQVEITVRDTGTGIPPEVLPRIFDPFFTTKGQDRGTGLGLSVAYGIIRQHDGQILVESEPGRGTVFTVLLPRAEPPRAAAKASDTAPPFAARGGETILVVEDEELVNELTVHILGEAGYDVLSACDGVEACEKFAGRDGKIDLVLMDVIMPRMGGREAAERIRAMQADTAVLFCSGYSGPALEMSMALPRNQPVLAKPYQPRDLLKRIREALDKRAAQAAN